MTVPMVPTVINGRWQLLLPEHRAVRPEWPWWEAARLAAMHLVLQTGRHTVWDVGAEEGDFPALWASWGNRVVLAEPNPRVWPNIRAIWQANGLPDPLLAWPGFLADQHVERVAQLLRAMTEQPWPACADGPVIGDHGFCRVEERPDLPSTTVDWLVFDWKVPAPTVLTMDVEGAEHLVLAGAQRTLQVYRPHVFVSVHPEFQLAHYGLDDGLGLVHQLLEGAGYRPGVHLATDHEQHWWWAP